MQNVHSAFQGLTTAEVLAQRRRYGENGDFGIIMAVVLLDAILGFVQEYQAQCTYTALKGLLKPTTTVIRDGTRQEIDLRELVPGDAVVLNAGERVPGDGEVREAIKLTLEEAILTGESEPIVKTRKRGKTRWSWARRCSPGAA